MSIPRISIIIPVYNQVPYTKLAIDSFLAHAGEIPFEFIIIDNGSRPEMLEYVESLRKRAAVVYVRNESNLGPIRAINQGIKASDAEYVMAIHNDVIVMETGWLSKIARVMDSDPKIGIVGIAGRQEIYDTGSVNEESLKHNLQNEDLNPPMVEEIAPVAVLDGLCFVMRRSLLEKINGLDEIYGYMHCYDLDISLASIDAGFRNVVVKIAAMHIGNGGITRKLRDYKELVKDDYGLLKRNCKILSKKWSRLLPLKVA